MDDLAREFASRSGDDREARVERESARAEPQGAGGDRRRGGGAHALSGRQRICAQGRAGRELRDCAEIRSCSATARNDVLELVTQAFLRPGDHAGVFAACVRRVSACHASARRNGHRSARRGSSVTISSECAQRSHRARVWCSSPIRTTRPARGTRPRRSKAFVAAVPRDVLIVLDEAYNEFLEPDADASQRRAGLPSIRISSCRARSRRRTVLAALRIGYGVMDPPSPTC